MLLHTFKISIALAFHSFDPVWGFERLVRSAHPTNVLFKQALCHCPLQYTTYMLSFQSNIDELREG